MNASRPTQRRRAGFAMVVALVVVAMLATTLASFVTVMNYERLGSETYVDGIQGDFLAEATTQALIFGLQQEIADNSTVQMIEGRTVYRPNQAQDHFPRFTVTSSERTAFPTLLRKSSRETSQQGNFPTELLASSVSTLDYPRRGSRMTFRRWNAPYLLDESQESEFISPDWIYWTAEGPGGATPLVNEVVGRVAYQVYDVSGLLNADVAGYVGASSSTAAGASTREIGLKGATAFADLTRLPGLTGHQGAIDQLVQWRYGNALVTAGDFSTVVDDVQESGFRLTPAGGDRLLDRQRLIRYFRELQDDGLVDDLDALAYLTVNSRSGNTPTLRRSANRPKVGDSGQANDQAAQRTATYGQDDLFNPSFPDLRWPFDATLNAGTPDERQVKQGDPFVDRRFNLDRIALLTDPAANAAAIARYFGLTDIGNGTWQYDHGNPGAIWTLPRLLQKIKAGEIEPREPDFFELLQAGILVGSLGRDAGIGHTQENNLERDQNTYFQVLAIGANIIDQYDADNYPTEIEIPTIPTTNTVHGIENLPYLQRVIRYAGRMKAPIDDHLGSWLLFEVWNPHQNPSTGATPDTPSSFRILAEGGMEFTVKDFTETTLTWKSRSFSGSDRVQFSTATQDFASPRVLDTDVGASFTTAAAGGPEDYHGKIVGLFITSDPVALNPASGGLDVNQFTFRQSLENTYRLQYNHPTHGWKDFSPWVDSLRAQIGSSRAAGYSLTDTSDSAFTFGNDRFHYAFVEQRADPRSDRFGGLMIAYNDKLPLSGSQLRPFDTTMKPEIGLTPLTYALSFNGMWLDEAGESGFSKSSTNDHSYLGSLAENFPLPVNANTEDRYTYVDPDGVRRRGDAAYSTANVAEGQPMYLRATHSRPVILNRPFRSVAELGYAFRDMPWKTLDFFTPESGDGALLDLFSVGVDDGLTAAEVSLQRAPVEVLEALLSGVQAREIGSPATSDLLSAAEAQQIAAAFVAQRATSPLVGRDGLMNWVGALDAEFTGQDNRRIKTRREAVARALADQANTGYWNLLIDVVAQSGKIARGGGLDAFVVGAERRCWVHLTLDRSTGEVVSQSIEHYYE